MPPTAAAPERGFLGVKNPSPRSPLRAAVLGRPGRFFESFLRSSAYVELYDEELDCEPYRRGIRTERVPPAALAGRIAKLTPRGIFPCLVGYGSLPGDLPTGGWEETVVLAPKVAGWEKAALLCGVRSGGRGADPRPPSQQVLSSRQIMADGGPRNRGVFPSRPSLLVIDPLVMDPPLFPVRGNIEPGGLSWHRLTALLRILFESGTVGMALVLPAPLPRSNPSPSFLLARLTAKVIAYALCR